MTQDEIWTDEIMLYPNSVIHPPLWCTTLNWPVGMTDSIVRLNQTKLEKIKSFPSF